MKRKNYMKIISVVLSLVLLVGLFSFASAAETELVPGPTIIKDPNSPTGYTVRFVYKNETANSVKFVGDILLKNWADPTDTKVYQPSEYKPGFMRGGGAYQADMEKRDGGYWVIDVPLAAGANQYWFYVDGNTNLWVTDPANPPRYAPDGLTGTSRRAFNVVYLPHDPEKQDDLMKARLIENPRTDEKKGAWDYVAIPTQIGGRTRYLGVYLPYGYDPDREEPYKTIYMQHGSGQDASDWMNIGSVPNIMDNLLAEGLTEPAIVVSTDSTYLGSQSEGYPNLFNIILPFIEENYNVSTEAADRSFAGLSMGGGITSNIINYDATKFGYYGIFSAGMGVRNTTPNLNVPYILVGAGQYDFGLPTAAQVAVLDGKANYKNIVVAGAHDFNTWCQLFAIYARDYLWKPSAFRCIMSIKDITVTTSVGAAPVLPGQVTVNWNDQTTSQENVVWAAIDPANYAAEGTFEVLGSVAGTTLKAKAIVNVSSDVLVPGPTIFKDPDSPTGYTVRFVYKNETAASVKFVGDILLRNWADPTDTKVYQPSEYRPGLMRGGGAYEADMEKRDGGYWVIEVPLAAGANQYWFYVDGNTSLWVTDPANSPRYAPDGLTGTSRRAFNAVYVPYDPEKQDEVMGARIVENPRTDGKTGTWDYVAIPTQIGGRTRYLGVYLPYGYDPDRAELYKTIYMQHGGSQDASDWLNIGSVPNIMDNLLAEGLTEPAIVVTTDSTYLGSQQEGYPNLFNIILPFIEENYNVSKNAADRSFAGLSMGGIITGNIINYDATKFGYYGVWSGGVVVRNTAANLDVPYILFAGGRYDFGLPNATQVAAFDGKANYKYVVVAGGHDFNTWCQLFTLYARDYLWKPSAFRGIKSIPDTAVTTAVGAAPVLPGQVTVNWNDQTTSPANVVWAEIDPSSYAAAGTFEVLGTVEGTTLKAKAVVTVTSSEGASLKGPGSINKGDPFSVTYNLAGVQGISAQDVIVSYDKDKFEFKDAEALPTQTWIQHTANNAENGTVRFIIVSAGAQNAISGSADILKMNFVSKAEGIGNIAITRAALGTGSGAVYNAAVSSISVEVVTQSNNKAELEEAIANAQAVYNSAVEGSAAGQYPTGSKDRLNTAIAAAIAVRDDSAATEAQIAQATADLNEAVRIFKSLVITSSTGELNDIAGVDIGDLAIIASNYGIKAGDPGWDAIKHADINGDGEIGLYELAFIAMRILEN